MTIGLTKMFTIRVYGLLLRIDEFGEHILVSDEIIRGRQITKYPGGGLEYGEGLKECLIREIREEMDQDALDLEHFYTTDFFQQSAFHIEPMQVISVYYFFRVKDYTSIPLITAPFAYTTPEQREGFRWILLDQDSSEDLSLPIDRLVLKMLKDRSPRPSDQLNS